MKTRHADDLAVAHRSRPARPCPRPARRCPRHARRVRSAASVTSPTSRTSTTSTLVVGARRRASSATSGATPSWPRRAALDRATIARRRSPRRSSISARTASRSPPVEGLERLGRQAPRSPATSPAQYPAGSGVGVSVLLRQAHGFEGFRLAHVELHVDDQPVPERVDPRAPSRRASRCPWSDRASAGRAA